jgi:hypothetical protein
MLERSSGDAPTPFLGPERAAAKKSPLTSASVMARLRPGRGSCCARRHNSDRKGRAGTSARNVSASGAISSPASSRTGALIFAEKTPGLAPDEKNIQAIGLFARKRTSRRPPVQRLPGTDGDMLVRCGFAALVVLAAVESVCAFTAPAMGAPRLAHLPRMLATAGGSNQLPPLKLGSTGLRSSVSGMPSSG